MASNLTVAQKGVSDGLSVYVCVWPVITLVVL